MLTQAARPDLYTVLRAMNARNRATSIAGEHPLTGTGQAARSPPDDSRGAPAALRSHLAPSGVDSPRIHQISAVYGKQRGCNRDPRRPQDAKRKWQAHGDHRCGRPFATDGKIDKVMLPAETARTKRFFALLNHCQARTIYSMRPVHAGVCKGRNPDVRRDFAATRG